jgi:hypothetical protein
MEQFAIGANFESAAARWNQRKRLDALAELENFGRQTDGLRRVVSNDAVFDGYFGLHRNELLSAAKLSIWLERVKIHTCGFPGALRECSLDPSALQYVKRSMPQPAPPDCAVSTSSTPNAFRVFSPEGVSPQDFLKGEIHAAAEHSEIIPGSIDHAKTQVVSPTEVPRESKFETGAELTE